MAVTPINGKKEVQILSGDFQNLLNQILHSFEKQKQQNSEEASSCKVLPCSFLLETTTQ